MQVLKRLVGEIHRRSLWQVLGAYAVGSWVALQVIDVLGDHIDLPRWVFPFALGLLLTGLPIVVIVALLQKRIASRDANGRPASALNWRTAFVAGIIAFGLFGVVASGWMAARSASERRASNAPLTSIAVLPFASVQTDEETQAFVSGIHDDLLTQLSKIDSLTVISRTSVMKYSGKSGKSIPEIARELGVATILEGGVQRAGNRVRVNVQLIEAETDKHLWAEKYDKELTASNIFDIQSDLASKIAGALRARLSPETQARIADRPTESLEAYDLVTRGRFIMQSRSSTREGVEAAAKLFQAAIAADSSYAPAHAELGNTYAQLFNLGYLTEHDALPKARAGAERALVLDPNLADAHVLRSRVLRLEGKYQDAETALRRALDLNPGSGTAHASYSGLLLELGRVEQALQEARRAVELDPLSTQTRISLLSRLLYADKYDEGIAEAGKLLELEPNIADAYYYAAFGRSMKGDHARAIEQFRKAIELNPEDPYYQSGIAWAYARAGRRNEAVEALKKAEEMKIPLKESAIVYAELGDLDRAYNYLERAYRTEPATLQSLKVDPSANTLRKDPRWNTFARKLGF